MTGGSLTTRGFNSLAPVNVSQVTKDDAGLAGPTIAHNCCYSSSNESTPRTWQTSEIIDRGDQGKPMRVMPDFARVYSFIGSVFDPNASGQLQTLKQMDPINLETRRLLASYDINTEKAKSVGPYSNIGADKTQNPFSSKRSEMLKSFF